MTVDGLGLRVEGSGGVGIQDLSPGLRGLVTERREDLPHAHQLVWADVRTVGEAEVHQEPLALKVVVGHILERQEGQCKEVRACWRSPSLTGRRRGRWGYLAFAS